MDEKFVNNAKRIIVITMLIVVAGVTIWWQVMKKMELKVYDYSFKEENVTSDFEYKIDTLNCVDGVFEITGWVIKPGENVIPAIQNIILKNTETGECYKIPTMSLDISDSDKNDIQEKYGEDTGTKACQYYAYTNYEKLDFDSVDYEVYMLIKSNDKEYIIPFNTTINEWESNDEK